MGLAQTVPEMCWECRFLYYVSDFKTHFTHIKCGTLLSSMVVYGWQCNFLLCTTEILKKALGVSLYSTQEITHVSEF